MNKQNLLHSFLFFLFIFLFFSPSSTFLIEGVLGSKNLFRKKLTGAPQKLGVDPFLDPVSHFGAPWRPFWIFEVLIEGMVK